jgi:predicted metalloprotease
LFRFIINALVVICTLAFGFQQPGLAAPTFTPPLTLRSAQAEDGFAAAADAVREFSRLEADRNFDALYERMHPDARAVVPRSAVVGWYESFYANRTTSEATIANVVAEPWTWDVTGVTYDDAVTVSYSQLYTVDGVTSDVAGEVHVVPYDGSWGWFFGASRSFVDDQIALYGDDGSATMYSLAQNAGTETPVPREVLFPDPLHADIDRFWSEQFAAAGRDYVSPKGVVAFDRPIVTACGRADPDEEAAFYCVLDEKIYYSASFRHLIETQIGDFAWVVVVAHEWGHHIQAQLGFDLGVSPDASSDGAPVELEQQADCLAGAYSVDAELNGWLDPGDINEALYMTEISGDPPGTAWNDPRAHGSSDQRVDAFLKGYSGGIAACGLDLSAANAGN